jgi:predicted outer membrane protein
MPNRNFAGMAAAAVLALLALPGCERTQAIASAASTASPADLAFMTDMYNVVGFDRQVIGAELKRPSDPRVAALAQDLLAQANAFDAKVRPIAERDGIEPPDAITFERAADHHDRLHAILTTGHADDDQFFLQDEIASHKQALMYVDTILHQPSGDPALKALSVEGVIRLRFNLQRLETLQREMLAAR